MENHIIDTQTNKQTSRRRFVRFPKKHKILIQTCDSIGTIIGHFTQQAVTLDYSQGGMRILIDREIPSDSLLRFDFGNDFVVPQLQGIAEICWHKQVKDTPQSIEVGLAFKDHFSQAVLAIQIDH
jgi:hypothetical protein